MSEGWVRYELILVVLVVLAGAALRLAYPSRMAVEHFDEGVYASNRWFPAPDFHYPNRYLYAPPLLSELIEWSFVLLGTTNFAAMLPSLLAGILTVPLVWWVIRSWSGPRIALTAAILVAGSDLHIAFSRAALTDALLLFWMVAAVGTGGRALVSRSWLWAIIGGVFAGLAWWTKYNGWLSLAILGAGGLAWALFPGRPALSDPETTPPTNSAIGDEGRGRRVLMMVGLWGVITATAIAVWAPYWWSLQAKGGYAAVAANHRGYFVGWNGWMNSLSYQSENLWRFSGWTTIVSMALAVLLPSFLPLDGNRHFTWNVKELLLRLCMMCFMAGGIVSTGFWLLLCGGMAAITGMVKNSQGRIAHGKPALSLVIWIQAAWFFGLLLATPLYTPYARLVLPWWLAAVLGTAMTASNWTRYAQLSTTVPAEGTTAEPAPSWKRRVRVTTGCMGVIGLAILLFSGRVVTLLGAPGWQLRTTCQMAARDVVTAIKQDAQLDAGSSLDQFAVYSYGEPAILFQLRLQGVAYVAPVEHLAFAKPGAKLPPVPTYVLVGPQAHRTHGFDEQFRVARPRLRPIGSYWLRSSELVQRDRLVENASDTSAGGEPSRERLTRAAIGPTVDAIRNGREAPSLLTLFRVLADDGVPRK